LKDALLGRLPPQEKDLVERIKLVLKGQNIEDTLRRFARDNKDQITEDELILAISKLNANVYLGDVKDLGKILKSQKDGKISIAEALQLLSH